MLRASQIRAARALLGLNQLQLSEISGVGLTTVKRLELSVEVTGSARTLLKIQNALEDAGVEFIPSEGEKGPGVRLRQKGPST